jgi:metal-responsive CopG/Arc/MetJ family transcriptional regulator
MVMKKLGNPFKLQIPSELKRELDEFAEKQGLTRSDIVRTAVELHLRNRRLTREATVQDLAEQASS